MENERAWTNKGGFVGEFPPLKSRKLGKIGLNDRCLLDVKVTLSGSARGELRLITCG